MSQKTRLVFLMLMAGNCPISLDPIKSFNFKHLKRENSSHRLGYSNFSSRSAESSKSLSKPTVKSLSLAVAKESEGVCHESYVASRSEHLLTSQTVGDSVGSIHIIIGPMFAGKTTELLRRVSWERSYGRVVGLVKSRVDVRYADSAIVSHDGLNSPCIAVSTMPQYMKYIGSDHFKEIDVIAVDEAQFIKGISDWTREAAEIHKKTVILAGLDGDFKREKFGELVDMIPIADTVTKLSAICCVEGCSRKAHFTFRRSLNKEQEVVGGSELYAPTCRHHYLEQMNTVKVLDKVEKQFQTLQDSIEHLVAENKVQVD